MRKPTLLVVAAVVAAIGFAEPAVAQAPRPDHRELTADLQVIQALNRLTFGARPGDATRVRSFGVDKWIDQQLRPERIDDGALEKFVARYEILNRDQNDLLRQYADAQRERRAVRRQRADTTEQVSREDSAMVREIALNRRQVVGQLQSARVARAVASNRQLEEVMTDFWLNHFNVFAQKGPPEPYYLAEYESKVIRPNALGKFRDLLEAVAKSPAMLFYLDNARSMADSTRPRLVDRRNRNPIFGNRGAAPRQRLNQLRNGGLNENYGRELLELHTLGVDGGYNQQDVINVARALTGWTIRPPAMGGGFIFRPEMHDAGDKVVLGHKLRAGRGIDDGEDVLDIVARHPSTARYIATRLVRRFVSDNPPPALVDEAAAVFMKTDGDIREVVRTIVTSNEFFSRQAFRGKVKSPFEVVVSAMRALNAEPDPTPRTALAVAYLGQPIYGHQAPNGYPETGEAWMNTGAILNRINFGMAVAANRLPGVSIDRLPGVDSLKAAPRDKQVDAIVSLLLAGAASPDTRAVLVSGQNPLAAKGDNGSAGNETVMQPTDDAGMEMMDSPPRRQVGQGAGRNALARGFGPVPELSGLAQVVGLALGSPEFQRR
jgi:uncharacterized protein (DUF1800 family)